MKKLKALKRNDGDHTIIYNYKGGFYCNGKKELIISDFLIETINIAKETELIRSCALKYSPLKTIEFEKNSQLNII